MNEGKRRGITVCHEVELDLTIRRRRILDSRAHVIGRCRCAPRASRDASTRELKRATDARLRRGDRGLSVTRGPARTARTYDEGDAFAAEESVHRGPR